MNILDFREWTAWVMEFVIMLYVVKEFYYDKGKDDKKQRRSRTIKKTTTAPSGEVITEEQTETVTSNEK